MRLSTLNTVRLPNHSLRLMAAILREKGHDLGVALKAAGIESSQVSDVRGEVTGTQELAFQRVFYELTCDEPLLWIELGARYRLLSHAHTFYGLTMATSANMQAAIETGLHFGDLHYTLSAGAGIYANGVLVGFHSYNSEVPPDLRRFSALRDLGTICTVFADLWGGPFPFSRVELSLPESDSAYVRTYLKEVPIRFGSECASWYWQVSLDRQKPPQSDPILHEYYSSQCAMVIDAAHDQADIAEFVTAILVASNGQLTLREAAARAGLSTRTLQRRLEQRGLSYRDLMALGRHQAACRLLHETKVSITRIALDVGYDNVSSFNHAFRRRAGISPRTYRQMAPPSAAASPGWG